MEWQTGIPEDGRKIRLLQTHSSGRYIMVGTVRYDNNFKWNKCWHFTHCDGGYYFLKAGEQWKYLHKTKLKYCKKTALKNGFILTTPQKG